VGADGFGAGDALFDGDAEETRAVAKKLGVRAAIGRRFDCIRPVPENPSIASL
jgi:hypothetical protein